MEEYSVIFGNLSDGIYRVVTGFETEDEAIDFLDDDGDEGFVIESEVYGSEDEDEDDESYDEDAE